MDRAIGFGLQALVADDRGRRRQGGSGIDFMQVATVPGSDVRTDAKGRFKVNPYAGNSFLLAAAPPDGEPYLSMTRSVKWPRGAVKQELEFKLPRGVQVRGKVIEQATGKAVASARVDFWAKGLKLPPEAVFPRPAVTGADGTFTLVLPAGPCHLVINSAVGGFETEKIAADKLHDELPAPIDPKQAPKQGEKTFYTPDAWLALDLQPGAGVQEVTVTLRRKTSK
jgi:hypothetical protein